MFAHKRHLHLRHLQLTAAACSLMTSYIGIPLACPRFKVQALCFGVSLAWQQQQPARLQGIADLEAWPILA